MDASQLLHRLIRILRQKSTSKVPGAVLQTWFWVNLSLYFILIRQPGCFMILWVYFSLAVINSFLHHVPGEIIFAQLKAIPCGLSLHTLVLIYETFSLVDRIAKVTPFSHITTSNQPPSFAECFEIHNLWSITLSCFHFSHDRLIGIVVLENIAGDFEIACIILLKHEGYHL